MSGPPKLGEYFLTDAFQYMIDNGSRLLVDEVDHWWDCGKPETLLETNRELLERGDARRPADADGVQLEDPVCVAPDVTLEEVDLGPNVSVGAGSVLRRCALRDCIVGEGVVLEACRLEESLVGDHVTARGLKGTVLLGDHTEIRSS
jgi:glucose-1-phosphate thymidylyltransferase